MSNNNITKNYGFTSHHKVLEHKITSNRKNIARRREGHGGKAVTQAECKEETEDKYGADVQNNPLERQPSGKQKVIRKEAEIHRARTIMTGTMLNL